MLSIGDIAPDFCLSDQHGRSVRLASLRGNRVMLAFLPLAFTGVCANELRQLTDDGDIFAAGRVEVYGISVDSMFSLRAWSDAVGARIRLLSDFWPHGEVASRYGVFDDETGRSARSTFAIDESGTIRATFSTPSDSPRTTSMYEQAIAEFDERL